MEKLINYILQFGNLDTQEIEIITNSVTELQIRKDEYFSKAGSIPHFVGFVTEGVLRGCYYNNRGEEITRCFISENSLVVDYANFEVNAASTEYIQACTHCNLLVFTKQSWEDLSHTIKGWDVIKNRIVQKCLYQKSRKSPVISHNATIRYSEFMENYPSLINRVALSHIASYLGVTQQSLSRIRKNIQ